jgi:hypothetical protein
MKLLPFLVRRVAWLGGLLASLAFLPTASAADAQARNLFAEGINDAAPWLVRVDVDHKNRVYRTGDTLTATVRSEKEGYLYLFNVDVDGEVTCLFPNKSQSNNKIPANTDVVVPDPNKPEFRIKVGEPTGRELLKAIVTTEPLKELKLDELKQATGSRYLSVTSKSVKKLNVELLTGDPDAAVNEGMQAYKDKVRQDKPQQYLQQGRAWAEHQVEITTVGKGGPNPGQGATGQPRAQERVGVFIGISQFQDKNIHTLQCSDKDALRMEEAMHKTAGLTKTYLLTNKEATFRRIQQTLCKDVADATRPGDLVVLYWSGHGGRCPHPDPAKSGEFQDFLVPHDGRLGNGSDLDAIRASMVLDDTFTRWVQALDGRKVVVILDACHSGGQIEGTAKNIAAAPVAAAVRKFGKAITLKNDTQNIKKGHFLDGQDGRMKALGQKDAIVLASSTAKQVSYERTDGRMSVMTYYLVEALDSVPSGDFEQVVKYVQEKVADYVSQEFPGTKQTPLLSPPSLTPPLTLKP